MLARYGLARHRQVADQGTRRRRNSGGFTLIEMLVAMVLTLIMVWAIAEFYARVGEAVKDGRAMIEQRSGLRTVTQRLQGDLSQLTVVPAPPVQDALTPGFAIAGAGYIEIFEGLCSDADPDGNGIDANANNIADIAEDLVPAPNGNGIPEYLESTTAPWTNFLGDIDDYIGFTMRSAGEPFTAQVVFADTATGLMFGTGTGTANLAEVAWWTSFKDDPLLAGSPGTWEPAETRSLHRRLLLIRPEVNLVHPGDSDYSGPYYFRIHTSSPLGADYFSVMQFCDVSVRFVGVTNNHAYYLANSLADLTRRENRFMHENLLTMDPADPTITSPPVFPSYPFPNPLDLNPNYFGNTSQLRSAYGNRTSQYRWILGGARRGEDVIVSNMLAFDVRVFDAAAALRADNTVAANATGALQPGDPGYGVAVANSHPIMGTGAYVDLFYNRYVSGTSLFSSFPQIKSGFTNVASAPAPFLPPMPAPVPPFDRRGVYCTWAASLERDGSNQDGNALTDEGTDGLDNDAANGVDDNGEHETSPPYPVRLRGLEVKVRTYEPGTRQVQQGTVSSDFIPE